MGILIFPYTKVINRTFPPVETTVKAGPGDELLVSRKYERIEKIDELLNKLLSFEASGKSLPPELLDNYFTEAFQEKYRRLSARTFEVSRIAQNSELKRLSRIRENEWQTWMEFDSADNQKSLLSFRLVFKDDLVDMFTLDQPLHPGTVPVIMGSDIMVIRIHCLWDQLKLPVAPQWLKQKSEREFLIGFQKNRIPSENLEIKCADKILKAPLDEGLAFMDESLMKKDVIPKNKKVANKPSKLEKNLQDALGFTVQ
ncbi:MAG: hypothetical protein V4736_10880 [Bdellovibrionota bacterium]